jgi:hypothetical protein
MPLFWLMMSIPLSLILKSGMTHGLTLEPYNMAIHNHRHALGV